MRLAEQFIIFETNLMKSIKQVWSTNVGLYLSYDPKTTLKSHFCVKTLRFYHIYRHRTLNRDRPSFAAIFVYITFGARFTAAPVRPWENIYYNSVLRNPAVKVKKMRFKQVSTAKLFQTYNFLPFLLFPNIPSLKGPFFTPKQFT